MVDLDMARFDEVVREHPLVFVEFYAPWCGHCKKLAPEWEKLAAQVSRSGVLVAKVDAIQEEALAKLHGVGSFPTLRLYRGGPAVSKLYKGARTAEAMAAWVATWRAAELVTPLADGSAAAVRAWAKQNTLAIVGITHETQGDATLVATLEAASFQFNGRDPGAEVPVALVSTGGRELLSALGAPGVQLPTIALFRSFDFEDPLLFYPGGASIEDFIAWFNAKRLPALIPGSKNTEEFFLTNIDTGHGLMILFGGDRRLRGDVHELAVRYGAEEPRLKWVYATQDEFGVGLAKTARLAPADFPEVVLWEFGDTEDQDKFFRLSQASSDELTKQGVQSFLQRWQRGELSAEKDPVLSITSDTFEDAVIRASKDVLVEFYAPWCGHCKSLAPEYRQLALHYAGDKKVAIVKMDATKHSHPSATVKSYPTIKLYRKGKKGEPIDLAFKSGRDKQSLIDFVEEHRATRKGKRSKKQKAQDGAPATVPPQATSMPKAPTPGMEATKGGVAEVGVWIFDDAMEPHNRGVQLSSDMVSSRSGYTLVQVGSLGLLVLPGEQAEARSVRHFSNAGDARRYVEDTSTPRAVAADAAASAAAPLPRALPCPDDADEHSCQAWCEGVSPIAVQPWRGTLAGTRCADRKGAGDKTMVCTCQPAGSSESMARCKPRCTQPPPVPEGGAGTATEESVCAAGDPACAPSAAFKVQAPSQRFFLYDAKYGEGFNLQREVYPRAGWAVAQLNRALEERCGAANTSAGCRRWALVLPPWCRVVHWWSSHKQLPWSAFFDAGVLQEAAIPVMEFHEYVALQGGAQRVDLVAVYDADAKPDASVRGGRGKFKGWAPAVEHCSGRRKIPEFKEVADGKEFVYSGHCEGGILASDYRCAFLDGPWPMGVVDMLMSVGDDVSSVLVKNYDYLLAPERDHLDALKLRESMLFVPEVRAHGEAFIAALGALGGRPYVAAHCRRTDFLTVHAATSPEPQTVAEKLNAVLAETGMDQVFVATDAQDDLKEVLQDLVKGKVYFYSTSNSGVELDHPGKQAAVEMWIASRATFFIGSQQSRVTMAIQLERGFLGKPTATSEQEFCKAYTQPGASCVAPSYRHPTRAGVGREAYRQ